MVDSRIWPSVKSRVFLGSLSYMLFLRLPDINTHPIRSAKLPPHKARTACHCFIRFISCRYPTDINLIHVVQSILTDCTGDISIIALCLFLFQRLLHGYSLILYNMSVFLYIDFVTVEIVHRTVCIF